MKGTYHHWIAQHHRVKIDVLGTWLTMSRTYSQILLVYHGCDVGYVYPTIRTSSKTEGAPNAVH